LEYEDVEDGDLFFNDLGGQAIPQEETRDREQKSLEGKKNSLSSMSESETRFIIE
jgi:hypothetical protein